jgi:hypothetical protein
MFLSNRGVVRKRIGRPRAGTTPPANCPHGSTAAFSLTHGCSFRSQSYSGAAAIPEAAAVGDDRRTAALPDPFALLMGQAYPGGPGTAWDFHRSVWTAIVSRRNHQSPRRAAAPNRNVCCGRVLADSRVLQRARELGTPPRPKRGPSRTILAWPLRHRPLLADAGCVPLLPESSSKDFRTGTAPHG